LRRDGAWRAGRAGGRHPACARGGFARLRYRTGKVPSLPDGPKSPEMWQKLRWIATPLPRQEVGGSVFKVYNQGVALMHAKNFAAAQIKFEQAIRDNPNFAEAHNNLGFTLRQQGPQNYLKALEHYNKAIQLKPTMAEAYEDRGVLFAKMGRKAAAEKDLVTLKKLNPKLAGELEAFLKTGKEEDEYGPTSPKQKS